MSKKQLVTMKSICKLGAMFLLCCNCLGVDKMMSLEQLVRLTRDMKTVSL
ncbi:hypothetical protein K2173_017006 [Erythroxylum novogranatense]|uniref:Uncharacterized protein n=1 Tax=Erythroxylum novogranatense TaxID=1862640 RepID=A0AAV8U893_9ROSI|nr:hypothetical protein K2173_017006 [Erythroxylum novogranatense]